MEFNISKTNTVCYQDDHCLKFEMNLLTGVPFNSIVPHSK